ncbi:MAG: heavy-metal-associated domain-containing protein [Clostridia bacterium]|nr:heavy-metal-associated domain-containing protein [Clostridia bacterium]
MKKKIFSVSGMGCKHCKNKVEEIVGGISGVSGKVNLKKGELLVKYEEEVPDSLIKEKVEEAGYTVTDIKEK